MRKSEPLKIVGAGPAGLTAAVVARRAGRPVVVYERNGDVGGRFHGDFQGLENWSSDVDVLEQLREVGIAPSFQAVPFREQTCFGPDGRAHIFRSPRPFYYLVSRGPGVGTLDRALKEQALAAGAEIRFGETVRQPAAGTVVSWGPRRADCIAVGYLFETDLPDGAFGALDDRLAPRGYGYLLVHQGRATLATFLFHDFRNQAVYLERMVEFFRDRLGFTLRNARRFGGVGNMHRSSETSGNLAWAGEAAGFQDALWGFGIRYAVLSGALAARRSLGEGPHAEAPAWAQELDQSVRPSCVN
ncbi:MAG TPA: NAD(P)/FAD-dependent oxidoreductase, partial [Thermoanaerobaculia bacterium]